MKLDRLIIWTPMPNHHHDAFHHALVALGINLQVNYYGHVRQDRIDMGWTNRCAPYAFERFVDLSSITTSEIDVSPSCVHTMPGIGGGLLGDPKLHQLLRLLVSRRANWIHWSEPFIQWPRTLLTHYKWWSYFRMVNKHGLGALANGKLAYSDFIKMGVSPERIVLHPYAPILPASSNGDDGDRIDCNDVSIILYVGQISWRKGADVLLKAFDAVKEQVPSVMLLIVGPDRSGGWFDKMRASSRYSASIRHAGVLPVDRLRSFYRQGTVVVVPSRFDGWGATVSEAASMGVPVVSTTSTGAAHQLIWPGVTGCIVKPGSVDQLARSIVKFVSRQDFCTASGEYMLEISRQFDSMHAARRFLIGVEGLLPARKS